MLKTIVGKKGKKRAKICQKLPECFKIAEDMCSLEYNLSIFNLQKPFRKYYTNLISNLCDCYPCSSPKQMRMYLLGVEPERVPLVHQVYSTKSNV